VDWRYPGEVRLCLSWLTRMETSFVLWTRGGGVVGMNETKIWCRVIV